MKRLILLTTLIAVAVTFTSCDKEERESFPFNEAIEQAFNRMYPKARSIEWEKEGEYYVVDFKNSGNDTEAWYDVNGNWHLTVTELEIKQLPDKVKTAFQAGEWSSWKVDDCDKVERNGVETVYVIEAESSKSEVHLVYNEGGELIKASENKQGHSTMPDSSAYAKIREFVKQKYPTAIILSIEFEKGMTEVDIRDGARKRELLFDNKAAWISTTTDVALSEVPQSVAAVINSAYPDYRIDDIELIESPAISYYVFELEKGNAEIKVRVDINGNILT